MSAGSALAIVDRPLRGPAAVEFLRCLAAWVATGRPAALLEARPGLAAVPASDSEVERYLDSLAEFGVRPLPADASGLRSRLHDARLVLRLGSEDRPGEPPLLVLDDALLADASLSDERLLRLVLASGQIVRIRA